MATRVQIHKIFQPTLVVCRGPGAVHQKYSPEHLTGNISKHHANIQVYMNSSTGIGEHSDVMEAVEQELDKIAKYHDQIEVLNKYFKK